MSSTAGSYAKGPAPWKSSFLADINKMDSPEFVFSSLHAAPKGSPTDYLPRARYCIFRGFWAELPENKHNEAPMNERVFESEMPTFTSDVRMMKIPEIFGSSAGHATKPEQSQGSGGGGPCEAVWWVKETQTQWRMKGEAFVVGPDIEGEGEESSGVRTVKSEVGSRMTVVKPGEEGDWSWAKELTAHFGNNSPGLRGSFRAPPPGQPTSEPYNDKELQLGSKVEDLNDPVARRNFRVMVIKPEQVEKLDLSDPVKARRQKYTFVDSSAEWKHEECWP
ncbi:hypothetical protein B0A49_03072 [Cryomyces minteri]|uniref:Pyridoxamine 5'-phosphate oxidase Alr4036 family FMN-binding domain-containing protein n=1 Tax=Cryomyces minteri TaxID=331657 RepID=A0A4U0X2B1_9PEZI|nr:hypothetical protein B0A49_06719 [Cryomyces minteri]TKA69248.1 hypothetical protein B0A49_03072 [Cryomyces minteri]